jgi:hypothetical protein
MTTEGPLLESLTHRLGEIPPEFTAEPRIGQAGTVHVDAVVHDILGSLGIVPEPADFDFFRGSDVPRDRNRLMVIMVFCWLLADEWFKQAAVQRETILGLLQTDASQMATQVSSAKIINDTDRREEVARLALARLGFRPRGESEEQAQDRLTSVSSIERARVVQAARDAEMRARAVREALVRKAAKESADKYTRE